MDRRPMSEMLADIADGVLASQSGGAPVHAARIEMRLPLDIRMRADGVLSGDLPLFRLRTDFDPREGWLSLTWTAVPS
jgi:hypothetical protein